MARLVQGKVDIGVQGKQGRWVVRKGELRTKNIVTDYSAVGDGVTSNATAFNNFKTWALAQADAPIRLTIPEGTYLTAGAQWMKGIQRISIEGEGDRGSTLSGSHVGGAGLQLENNRQSVRIEAAAASDTVLTVKNVDVSGTGRSLATLMALFVPGRWVLVAAFDQQGFGYPTNVGIHEYAQIASVGVNTITLTEPLANAYSDDLPHYSTGNLFNVDQGGPATVYALASEFEQEVTLKNLVYDVHQQAHGGKFITFDNCTIDGEWWPSVSKRIVARDCDIEGFTEVDKILDVMELRNCSINTSNIVTQSSEPQLLLMEDCDMSTKWLQGTPKNTIIRRSSFNAFNIGPTGYGASATLLIEDSIIPTPGYWTGRTVSLSGVTYGGVNMIGASPFGREWAIPGTVIMFEITNQGHASAIRRVTDFYVSGSNNVVVLDRALDSWISAPNTLRVHPCPDVTVNNCTGSAWAWYMSQAPDNIPYASYWKYQLTEAGALGGGGTVWGQPASYRVNVTRAYTGVASTLYLWVEQFGAMGYRLPSGTYSTANGDRFSPKVNLRITGDRVYTPSGRTGIQSGDNSTEACNIWLSSGCAPYLGSSSFGSTVNISGESPSVWPMFTVELITDPL